LLIELDRPDYPEGILPFHDHAIYQELDPQKKSELLSWAWIAHRPRAPAAARHDGRTLAEVFDHARPRDQGHGKVVK
jgi:hypothetical protein